jgi:hypothetical protein
MTGPSAQLVALDTVNPFARPRARFDPIEVRAFETRTGRVIARLPFIGIPRWSNGVCYAGEWSVNVKLGVDGISKELLDGITDPWRISVAISQGSKIWQAGPYVAEDYNDGDDATTLSGGGLFKLLTDKRVLINPARATLAGVASQDADVLFGPTGYVPVIGGTVPAGNQNLSLHTIFKRILQTITTATGGDLPLVYPADIAGTSAREYPGYDLAAAGQRLTELSQVENGPEFEFAPEFVDPSTRQYIRWNVRIGNPNLGNLTFPHVWDQDKALIGTGFTKDGGWRITRDFERGNGMNRDLVLGFADTPVGVNPSDILLESVGSSHTSASDTSVLNSWAKAAVAAGSTDAPILLHRVRVPGDDGFGNKTRSANLTEISNGDNGLFVIKNHPRILDGTYACRIIRVDNGSVEQTAVLTTQLLGKVTT